MQQDFNLKSSSNNQVRLRVSRNQVVSLPRNRKSHLWPSPFKSSSHLPQTSEDTIQSLEFACHIEVWKRAKTFINQAHEEECNLNLEFEAFKKVSKVVDLALGSFMGEDEDEGESRIPSLSDTNELHSKSLHQSLEDPLAQSQPHVKAHERLLLRLIDSQMHLQKLRTKREWRLWDRMRKIFFESLSLLPKNDSFIRIEVPGSAVSKLTRQYFRDLIDR